MKVFIYLIILGAAVIHHQVCASNNPLDESSIGKLYQSSPVPGLIENAKELDPKDKNLLFMALEVSKKAYCLYSGYHVGCALETEKGNFFTGCNVENDSYGLTTCSERTTLPKAISKEGPLMKLKRLAVIVVTREGTIGNEGSPCGACRQYMAQFGVNAEVIYYYKDQFYKKKVSDLLPHPFVISKE